MLNKLLAQLATRIRNMTYYNQLGTKIGTALQFYWRGGDNDTRTVPIPDAKKVVVLLTDGKPYDPDHPRDPSAEVALLKQYGPLLFSSSSS
jgi:uncharacterized protein YegL